MSMRSKVDDVYCRDCGEENIYIDVKEEPSLYKIGAMCDGCDRDYGVLNYVSRTDIDHMEEVWEEAEAAVSDYLG